MTTQLKMVKRNVMTNKHMGRCSTSPAIREVQVKPRDASAHPLELKWKGLNYQCQSNQDSPTRLMGEWESPCKAVMKLNTHLPCNLALLGGETNWKRKVGLYKDLCPDVSGSFTHHEPDLELSVCSLPDEWRSRQWCIQTKEHRSAMKGDTAQMHTATFTVLRVVLRRENTRHEMNTRHDPTYLTLQRRQTEPAQQGATRHFHPVWGYEVGTVCRDMSALPRGDDLLRILAAVYHL